MLSSTTAPVETVKSLTKQRKSKGDDEYEEVIEGETETEEVKEIEGDKLKDDEGDTEIEGDTEEVTEGLALGDDETSVHVNPANTP